MKKLKVIIVVIYFFQFLSSCKSDHNNPSTANILNDTIFYINRFPMFVGSYKITSNDGDSIYFPIGESKYFYPSGKIEVEIKYSNQGDKIEQNGFFEKGSLKDTWIIKDKTIEQKMYSQEGKLQYLSVEVIDDDSISLKGKEEYFHNNGMISEEMIYQESILASITRYDTLGNKIGMLRKIKGKWINGLK